MHSPPSASVWSALESMSILDTFPVTWRRFTGDHFPAFKALCLQPSSPPPRSYPCPIECGCWHKIILRHDGVSALGACECEPPACPDLELTLEDITSLEVNPARLGRAIAKALLLDAKPADLPLPNTSQLGSWSTDAVPVILTLQVDPVDFRSVIAETVARLRRPFILISPTASHMTVATQEILTSAGAALIAMDAALTLTPLGTLLPTYPPGEIFAAFTPQPKGIDVDAAQRAFALIQQLESTTTLPPPTVLTVFRLYCIDALSAAQIARRCYCSKTTILNRLALIRQKTGTHPNRFRTLSSHLANIENQLSDPRARHIRRQSATDS